ncbi:MAG: hypothetical protein OXC07_06560 [Kistimonas sp.]|nr:hypothetical protein [Kistimonas sp.]
MSFLSLVSQFKRIFRRLNVDMIKNFSEEERLLRMCKKQKMLYRKLYSVLIEIEGRRGHICMTSDAETEGEDRQQDSAEQASSCVLRYQVEAMLTALGDDSQARKVLWQDYCREFLELPFSDELSRRLDAVRLAIDRLETTKKRCMEEASSRLPLVQDVAAFELMQKRQHQQELSEQSDTEKEQPIKFTISKRR